MSSEWRAVAVRHVAFEDLGILEPILVERGFDVTTLQAGVDSLDSMADADVLVVLGGPIGVGDVQDFPFLQEEVSHLRQRLEHGLPTLGICLGAQLMAAALGARVTPSGSFEVGYRPLRVTAAGRDSVLAGLDGVPVLHWHGDVFGIPSGARRLAETDGFSNQAFDLGPAILALQFHIEARWDEIERWLIGHSVELADRGVSVPDLREQARRWGPQLESVASALLRRWIDTVVAAL